MTCWYPQHALQCAHTTSLCSGNPSTGKTILCTLTNSKNQLQNWFVDPSTKSKIPQGSLMFWSSSWNESKGSKRTNLLLSYHQKPCCTWRSTKIQFYSRQSSVVLFSTKSRRLLWRSTSTISSVVSCFRPPPSYDLFHLADLPPDYT